MDRRQVDQRSHSSSHCCRVDEDAGRPDLTDRADVEVLPRRFYGRVFADHVLAEPFTELGAKGLDPHLRVMCDFWENRSVPRGAFHGNALLVHRQLDNRHPLSASHFVRWLALWIATDDEMYPGTCR